jgi:hypothetical protein
VGLLGSHALVFADFIQHISIEILFGII